MADYQGWLAGEVPYADLPEDVRKQIDADAMSVAPVAAVELIHKAVDEKRFTLGPWYIPNRLDAHSEWTDAEELQAGLWDYVRKGDRGIRLQHNRDIIAGEWVEAMQLPVQVTMRKAADGAEVAYPEGTVFLGVVWKPWAWDLVKQGKIRGFSIGGSSMRLQGEPSEQVVKAADADLAVIPASVRVDGRLFSVRPEGTGIFVRSGDRSVLLEGAGVAKSLVEERLGIDANGVSTLLKEIREGDIQFGMWVKADSEWGFVKGSMSRSEAERAYPHDTRTLPMASDLVRE